MTTESGTAAPPLPSISVPPSITIGACAKAPIGNSATNAARQEPRTQFLSLFMTVLLRQSHPESLFSRSATPGTKVYFIQLPAHYSQEIAGCEMFSLVHVADNTGGWAVSLSTIRTLSRRVGRVRDSQSWSRI